MSEFRDFDRVLHELHRGLESASYYDFLGLDPQSDYVELREAFYERSQRFHPDRFVASDDEELKARVYQVYKRMTEAYNVLSDPQLRVAYDRTLQSGENRLSDVARSRRLSAQERAVNNTLARIYLRSGRAKLERDDVVGAWIDCRLALSLDDSPPLLALRDDIRRNPNAANLLGDEA
jgi:DnaJ-class molecular chaperone